MLFYINKTKTLNQFFFFTKPFVAFYIIAYFFTFNFFVMDFMGRSRYWRARYRFDCFCWWSDFQNILFMIDFFQNYSCCCWRGKLNLVDTDVDFMKFRSWQHKIFCLKNSPKILTEPNYFFINSAIDSIIQRLARQGCNTLDWWKLFILDFVRM